MLYLNGYFRTLFILEINADGPPLQSGVSVVIISIHSIKYAILSGALPLAYPAQRVESFVRSPTC